MLNCRSITILVVVVSFFAACSSGNKIQKQRYNCSNKITEAKKKFENKKYSTVKILLDDVKVQCQGHESMDTALYYLAKSLIQLKLFSEAKLEFQRLTQDFPGSTFYPEAVFRIGYCMLKESNSFDRDQTGTKEAVTRLQEYLETFTDSPFADSAKLYMVMGIDKLAEKEFVAAGFYHKMKEFESAVIYYKAFVKDYPSSKFAPAAMLNLSEILIDLNRKEEAKEILDEVVAKETNGENAKKARDLLAKIK